MKTLNTSYHPVISLRITEAFGSYAWVNSLFCLLSVSRTAKVTMYLTFFILLVSLSSCGNKNAEDIEKELSNGVVLIQNKSYYEVKLSNRNTDDGLKLQFGYRSINRRSTDEIIYTISFLPSGSGYPIVNRKGEFVAVNGSGIKCSDSFNCSVRVKHLNKLVNNL